MGYASFFWSSAVAMIYSYVGYALLLASYGSLRPRPVRKALITPSISMIIAAYNEQRNIEQKLENSLALDYPADALQIIVVSDGSDDQTNAIVSRYTLRGIKFLALPRGGKIVAIDAAVLAASNDILVFSDASVILDSQALRRIAMNFADSDVGGVCGNQIYIGDTSKDSTVNGERTYWDYDKWLKRLETRTGNIVSADGSVYAVRRALYRKPESFAVTDDFAISTAVIEQGYRLVFEQAANAYEAPAASAACEFRRKVRIINRGLRGVLLRRKLLNPFRFGFYSLVLFSHKLLRRLVPFLLLTMFVTSIVLSRHNVFYLAIAAGQTMFYGLAVTSYSLRNTAVGQWKIFYIPFFYCLANVAALVAVYRLVTGKRIELWQPQR